MFVFIAQEQRTEERMPRLNEKLKKLVDTPRPHIIKHEGELPFEMFVYIQE